MRAKYIVLGSIALLAFWAYKKKQKENKVETALKQNEMPIEERLDIVRVKFDDWLQQQMSFMSKEDRYYTIETILSKDISSIEENGENDVM